MFFFDFLLAPPKAGRHTEAGVIRRLQADLADLRASRDKEVRGHQDALQKAAKELAERTAERNEARGRSDHHLGLLRAATAEVERLKRLLAEDAGVPAAQAPAPADVPGSCFTEDDPAPVTEGPRAVADTPAGPVECEAADVTAKTRRDTSLLSLAMPGEEEMAAELDAMRAANAITRVIPVIPDRPPVADPTETALNIPAPPPGAGASEISMAAGLAAVTKVHATVTGPAQ